jgi:RNA polymerase sigma factor (sigma-70 family)
VRSATSARFAATTRAGGCSRPFATRPEAVVAVDEVEALAPEPGLPAGDPAAACDERQLGAALNEAIAALPAEFREALLLREVEGMSYKEIAAVVDAPIGTVMSRLARARAILRVKLAAAGWR